MDTLNDHKRLLVIRKLEHDESFMGYILRLTELNRCPTPSWILKLADITQRWTSVPFNDSLNLSLLAQLANVEESRLAALMYPTAELMRRKMGDYLVFGSAVPQYLIRPDCLKICTYCLKESGYVRKIWEIIPVTVCPIHKCLLLDKCPNCQARLTWVRKSISRCQCEFDWREYSPPLVEENELLVTKQIYQLCNLIPTKNKRNNQIKFNPLYELELRHFLSALIFIASQYGGFIATKGKFFASLKQNVEIHILLCKAFPVFDSWPENFFSFLDWRREQKADTRFKWGMRRDFSQYKSALFTQLASEKFDFLRRAFEEYLLTHWKGGYSGAVRRFQGKSNGRRRYVSRSEAREMLCVDYSGVDSFMARGLIKVVSPQQGVRGVTLIDLDSVKELKGSLDHGLFLKHVREQLGVCDKHIKELIKYGLLNPLRGRTVDGCRAWKFSHQELNELLDRVNHRVLSNTLNKTRRTTSFLDALEKLGCINVGICTLIADIIDGKINPYDDCKRNGLAGLGFDNEEISNYILQNLRKQAGKNILFLKDVAALLDVPYHVVRFFVKKGLIPIQKKRAGMCVYDYVDEEIIDQFNSAYVLPSKLAKTLRTDSGYLTALFLSQGLRPVCGKGGEQRYRYVFKRSEVEALDLVNLLSATKIDNVTRYKEKRIFNEKQAAKFLGVSLNTTLNLVTRGILKPHNRLHGRMHITNEHYFSLYTLEKLKDKIDSYTGLVASCVAAKMLGIGVGTLLEIYVNTGRLEVAMREGKRGDYYFKRMDVKALADAKRKLVDKTVGSTEAAKILKVGHSTIYKLTLAGILKPVSGPQVDGLHRNLYMRKDINRLKRDRKAFKEMCLKLGKTARYGRAPRPRPNPVQEKVLPRIEQIVRDSHTGSKPKERITGSGIHRQLINEGYKIGPATVYKYLRNKGGLLYIVH
jgi:predicted site-specific integrase-resolvase